MKLRLKDIAEIVGVSIPAVSQVLNNKPIRISDEKKREIIEVARQNNYIPNTMARSLVSNRTYTIGLLLPDITNPFFSELAKCLEEQLRQEGYILFFANSNDTFETEVKIIKQFISRGVDGLLIVPGMESFNNTEKCISLLNDLPIPYLLLDRFFNELPCNQIYYDNERGSYLATQFLIESGHKKIGMMIPDKKNNQASLRIKGFKKAHVDHGVRYDDRQVINTRFSFNDAYNKSLGILTDFRYSALLAGNDLIALGIKRRCDEIGIHVPKDVSLISFDKTNISTYLGMNLTAVEQNTEILALEATKSLLKIIDSDAEMPNIILKPELHLGESVKEY